MDAYIICLANSLKRGGRCIAGIEITIDYAGNWSVVRNADGSPKWIRPIDATTEFGEIMMIEARNIQLMSVVKLESIVPVPSQSHTEDVHYRMMKVVGRINASKKVLRQFVDTVHHVIFYGTDRAIDIPTYAAGDHSLMFIHADKAEIIEDIREEKTRYRMLLEYNDVTYDLSVTDPFYIEALNDKRAKIGRQPELYVTLSLGLVYEGRHHKLIASVIVPSMDENPLQANKILDEKEGHRVISIRPLTKEEQRTIKKAFVVPSLNGFAVCFRRRNGGEDFLPIDVGEDVCAWQKVAPKSIEMVTYSDHKRTLRIKKKNDVSRFFYFFKKLFLFES